LLPKIRSLGLLQLLDLEKNKIDSTEERTCFNGFLAHELEAGVLILHLL